MTGGTGALLVIVIMVVSAGVFWGPDMVLHAVRGYDFSGRDVKILTCLLPLLALAEFWTVRHWWPEHSRTAVALSMLLGIWLSGPLCMAVGASFSGGGFARPLALPLVVIETALFPIFTFMLSAYDGTLFAVLLTTAFLISMMVGSALRSGG